MQANIFKIKRNELADGAVLSWCFVMMTSRRLYRNVWKYTMTRHTR